MRINTLRVLFLSVVIFLSANTFSQVTVSGSTGANGTYARLALAFTAINGAAQTGNNIVITITANTTETVAATLNAGAWTTLKIYPTVTGLTITGSLATPLIDLNGADNVTIDGRVNPTGTTKDLIITNTSTSTTAGTSTIRFINTAQNNTIKYCNIKGAQKSTTSGIILFSTATSGTGNSNNLIDNNNITSDAAGRTLTAIYSAGSASYVNTGVTISNNNIYNFWNATASSYAIMLGDNTTDFTITGNSFYETTSLVPTGTFIYQMIRIYTASTAGNNFVISNNYFGGTASQCGGTALSLGTTGTVQSVTLDPIRIGAGTVTASSIQGNTITNISFKSSNAEPFRAIYAVGGNLNIGTITGNIIGDMSTTGSILLTATAATANSHGIYSTSAGTLSISNNTFGSITVANSTATNAHNFYAVNQTATAASLTVENNIIGSTTLANSINATSTSTSNAQSVYGIFNAGSGTIGINGNTISNLTNGTTNTTAGTAGVINGIASSTGTNTISNNLIHDLTIANANTSATNTASVCGIALTGATLKTVSQNVIYNLSNTYTSFAGNVIGLYFTGNTGSNVVSKNYVYSLSVSGASSTTATIYGIKMAGGATTYSNNLISLGGNSATTLYGIYETGAASNNNSLYFNTVYIGGSLSAGVTNKSYALYSAVTTNTRNFRNNIFDNARSTTSGSSLHYAAYFNYAVNTSLTLDYNDYYAPGTGGVLGYYNGGNKTSLPIVTGLDANSINTNPAFTSVGSTLASGFQPTTTLTGITGTGITVDFDNITRSGSVPTMGVWEYFANPVEVWNGTTFRASYATLKGAFDKINDGTWTGPSGDLIIKFRGNTTETASAVLNASGTGSSNYSHLTIYPVRSGVTVTGSLATPLVDLNGADNVVFDGHKDGTGSTPEFTFSNTSTSSTAGTSTFRFINDAVGNTIQNSTIKGSTTDATGGIIFFSTTSGTTGNDANTIQNNSITNTADANRPLNAIYSTGTSTKENSQIIIQNNNFYDFLNKGTASNGIYLGSNTTAWTISGNSFYETTSFIPTAGVSYNVLQINNTAGVNFSIADNYFGGKAALCAGAAWTKTNAQNNAFTAINLNIGTDTVTTIQHNIVRNISWGNSGAASWTGINLTAGKANIGTITGNIIGNQIGTGSITVTGGATATNVYGIYISSTGVVDCQNNTIASVTVANGATLASNFYGIYKSATSGTTTINENTIGSSTVSNSIYASSGSTSNAQSVYGIYSSGSGTVTVSGNTVANLNNGTTNTTAGTAGLINGITSTDGTLTLSNNKISNLTIANANTATNNTASVIGLALTGTSSAKTISGNTINNLSNTYATFAGRVIGLYYEGSTSGTNEISKNFINTLTTTGTSGASLLGIQIVSGVSTYSNNIINLGSANQNTIYGIYDTGAASQTCNLYFNTVYISGVVAAGAYNSYAFYSAAASNTRNYRNNIFYNARTRSAGTSSHFAVYYNVTGVSNLTADYNDYYTSAGTGAVLAYYGANRTTLAAFKTAITPQDPNSLNTNPTFTLAGSTVASDYQLGVSLNGITGTGIGVDYGSNSRGSTPTVGAWERNLNKWKGTTSNDWNTSTNWTGNTIPAVDATIIFDPAPINHCVMDQDRSVTNIINAQSTYRMVTNGHKLTVKGNLNFTGGAQIDASATNSTVEFAGTTQTIPAGSFYNDAIYNLTINNPNNVTLNGTLRLLNNILAPLGQLDATTYQPVVSYAGSTSQTIEGSRYLNDEVTKLTIDNASGVTLNTDFTVDTLLTVNSGKYLVIPTETQLNVIGTITNNAGVGGIYIRSDSLTANGTLIFHNLQNSPVLATVEMYTKAYYDPSGPAGYKYKWQYFGTPLAKTPFYGYGLFDGSYVRKWVESGTTISNHWINVPITDSLYTFKGYEITQTDPKFIYFQGQLVNSDYSSGQLPYTSSALYPGESVLANSYTSAIDIRQLNFGSQMEWTVYMYNCGSYNDWNISGAGNTPGNSPGQYTSVPIFTAGYGGLPSQIPSMNAFLVKAMSVSANATLSYSYTNSAVKNTDLQHVKRFKSPATTEKSFTILDVTGSRFADRMWLFSDPACTHSFDNGWDGVKAFGSALYPQIYSVEADGNYQTDGVNDIHNTDIGFKAGEDSVYTLTVTHQNMETLYPTIYLEDLKNNTTTDISQSGTQFTFVAHATDTISKRFRIVTSTGIVSATNTETVGKLKVFSSNHTVFVHNTENLHGELSIYDISGQLVSKQSFGTGISTFPLNLGSGIYIAKVLSGKNKVVSRLVIHD